ncbi:MAG: hypothetical protein M1820_010442 [Bogoriella megaspora]|nr:MAG: hypothetical protein M1820_010442 [Bogoriella megaspora]
MAGEAPNDSASADIYQQVNDYPWHSDQEFQSGLQAILATRPPEEAHQLTLQARCFYYARKFNTAVDPAAYLAYLDSHSNPPDRDLQATVPQASSQAIESSAATSTEATTTSSSTSVDQPAPYPKSFAEVVELIQSGKPILGIKDIPSTVLTGQGTESAAAKRKKPWENEEQRAVVTTVEGGT